MVFYYVCSVFVYFFGRCFFLVFKFGWFVVFVLVILVFFVVLILFIMLGIGYDVYCGIDLWFDFDGFCLLLLIFFGFVKVLDINVIYYFFVE